MYERDRTVSVCPVSVTFVYFVETAKGMAKVAMD